MTPYAFDRCDGCGAPLPEADRLWGFCSVCLCLPAKAKGKAKPPLGLAKAKR